MHLAVTALAIGTLGLVGCDRSSDDGDIDPTDQKAQATVPEASPETAGASGVYAELEDHDVLAIHGDFRIFGEPLPIGHGTDGPRRYRPLLMEDGSAIDWPLDEEVVSEALLVGERPTLFVLGLDGTLTSLPLDGSDQPSVVDREVSSQITASIDGCCVAYIRDSYDQTLHIHHLDRGELYMVMLGYSFGWAPALSPGGEHVAWTASPQGHPSILSSYEDAEEPRIIVNTEENLDVDHLDPFPTGVHQPIWTSEGIAFEGKDNLWLTDEAGTFIGLADADDGMFWDEPQGELVNRFGAPIKWEDPESQRR